MQIHSLQTKRLSLTVKGSSLTSKRAKAQPQAPQGLGKSLKLARIAAGLGQADVAKRLDVHEMTVSAWERDRQKPDEQTIGRLADLYSTTRTALRYGNSDGMRVREVPPVALGLPQQIRLWIQEFLLELVRAEVSEREVDEARRVLTSPELSRLLAGGEPGQETEAQILRGLEGFGAAIKDTLRSRGYELAK